MLVGQLDPMVTDLYPLDCWRRERLEEALKAKSKRLS